jgi:hypothetical protein
MKIGDYSIVDTESDSKQWIFLVPNDS